jgi:hypothetical protein
VRIVLQVHQILLNFKIGQMGVVHQGGAMEKKGKVKFLNIVGVELN